ncbi:MAG: CRISPR-associated endonuclease Cas3'', partial [Planctomycetota bacterium]|nr:CRISPR-associated endonuclease Cas3'' [Planctomycetota bacterium]
VTEMLGKNGRGGVIIATQVVEAGVDISANIVLSELAPMDALLQRAGRCARWGGKGLFVVLAPNPTNNEMKYGDEDETLKQYMPNFPKKTEDKNREKTKLVEEMFNKTKEQLQTNNDKPLRWELEKELVNSTMTDYLLYFIDERNDFGAKVFGQMATAVFKGDRNAAAETVRSIDTVEVSIHGNPQSLGKLVWYLPRLSLSRGMLWHLLKKGAKIWYVKEKGEELDEETDIICESLSENDSIRLGSFYVIHPGHAKYDENNGLRVGEKGESLKSLDRKEGEEKKERAIQGKLETWLEHALNTVKAFETVVLPKERYALEVLKRATRWDEKQILEALKLVIALHDLGKLTVEWQKGIYNIIGKEWASNSEPLAHSGTFEGHAGKEGKKEEKKTKFEKLPPHAPISAYVLGEGLSGLFNDKSNIARDMELAIAHHHSVHAISIPAFRFVERTKETILDALNKLGLRTCSDQVLQSVNQMYNQEQGTELSHRMVSFAKAGGVRYTADPRSSRILRVSDRIASGGGGENALHSF